MLENLWDTNVAPTNQPCCQQLQDCIYWPVLGYFNNWNIIIFSNKTITSENFDEFHQVVIDGIIENMPSIFQSGNYGDINTTDSTTIGYYVIIYVVYF